MRTTILIFMMLFFASNVGAQSIPPKSVAEKDIKSKVESVNKQLKYYGANLFMKDMTLEFDRGYYKKYSSTAAYYGYNYISEPDMLYYVYSLKSPKYANGDQFIFDVKVSYDSYRYQNQGYRTALNNYTLHSVNVTLKSYEGKDLNDQVLLEKLNRLSIENGKKFDVGNYEFVRVDSVNFTKLGKRVVNGITKYDYKIDMFGYGVEYMYAGVGVAEYEVKSSANIQAVYKSTISLNEGEWKMHDVYFFNEKNENVITNIEKDFRVPAYVSLRSTSLKNVMAGETIVDEIPKTTYRALNDLKRLLVKRLDEQTRETFVEGEMLTHLFSSDKGQEALDVFYGFKKTMTDYHLKKEKFDSDNYGVRVEEEGEYEDVNFTYSVSRKLTTDELKAAKKDGVTSKEALKILKYPVKGYLIYKLKVKLEKGKFVVSDFEYRNRVTYKNGSDLEHPMYKTK